MRYVISDTHFGHGNIIEYCNRPFDSVEEMNRALVENWNTTVSPTDSVLFLGDVRHHPSSMTAEEWLKRLNGNILVVRGNHDGGLSQNARVPVVESCVIQHGRYQFYCEHQPTKYSGWQIHGHVHDNAPLIDTERQLVNVSAEAVGYQPMPLDDIIHKIENAA